jgi:YHS domain-containing protein
MTVDRSKALTAAVDGHTFYFCSEHCLHAFDAKRREAGVDAREPTVTARCS